MSNQKLVSISNGMAFGTLAGRVIAVALALYVVSLIYRSGAELGAIALGGLLALYVATSLVRDIQYGYSPWEPINWTTVSPSELNAEERRRALRWTITRKLLLVVGAVGGLAIVFTAGLETLGYVLLIGGLPAFIINLYKHYLNDTRPWYPSVPSYPDRLESNAN